MDVYLLEQFGSFNAYELAKAISQGDEVAQRRLMQNGRRLAKQFEHEWQAELNQPTEVDDFTL